MQMDYVLEVANASDDIRGASMFVVLCIWSGSVAVKVGKSAI